MRLLLALLAGIASALVLGLGSAWIAVRSPAPIDAISIGAWQAWPHSGTPDVDPYSRARLARTGAIPLGSGEGLELLAQTDDSGRKLTSRCDYRIAGATPPARLWTLAVEDPATGASVAQNPVPAVDSEALLRQPDGSFEIALAPAPKVGNWVSTASVESFQVVVRLYDTTARLVTALTTLTMPRIVRESCRG